MGGMSGQGNSVQSSNQSESRTASETTVETSTGNKTFNITNTGGKSNAALWASRVPWWVWLLLALLSGGAVWKFSGKK
jgi:hypothetical protein